MEKARLERDLNARIDRTSLESAELKHRLKDAKKAIEAQSIHYDSQLTRQHSEHQLLLE